MDTQLTIMEGHNGNAKPVTIESLYGREALQFAKDRNKLNILLNQNPPEKWLKKHPFASNVQYLPVERVEFLLRSIFLRIRWQVIETKVMANSVSVTVRLHYIDPITNEWDWQDGVGAAPLQTDAGAGAIDFNHIKNDAVMKALPAAKSFAKKDAAEELGKIFGADLNRKNSTDYNILQNKFNDQTELSDKQKSSLKRKQQ